jgi:hypothetical protein
MLYTLFSYDEQVAAFKASAASDRLITCSTSCREISECVIVFGADKER